jgi:hypothetical protein
MHILWTNHPLHPDKNGTKEHVPQSVAEVAIAYEQATRLARPNYGTPEWAAERQAADAARKPQPGDVPAPFFDGTRWGIQEHPLAGTVLVRECGSEITRIGDSAIALQHGCPKKLADEFNKIIRARMKQNEENAAIEQKNNWNRTLVSFI